MNAKDEGLMAEPDLTTHHQYYRLLPDGTVEPTDDMKEVTRCVGKVLDRGVIGWIEIVTFFLALDCGTTEGRPLIWETALEHGGYSRPLARYSTRELAQDGHEAITLWAVKHQNKLYAGWMNEESVKAALEAER